MNTLEVLQETHYVVINVTNDTIYSISSVGEFFIIPLCGVLILSKRLELPYKLVKLFVLSQIN